ncbi:MAG: glycoside hydrolase family 99-like domain-containing protein, partial [Bacteroidales bacterium]
MNNKNISISNRKKLIVILGMHRSGTSAITRGLQVMGVQLGDRLMPAVKNENDKGFWEDIDIYALNNEILECINREWHSLSLITQNEIELINQKDYFNSAVKLLKQKTDDFAVFGLKNPSLTVLLPFWKKVFEFLNFDVSYILAIRNPLSVVKSLEKRNGFELEKSYFLWITHVINGLSGTNSDNRIVVDYDNLMQNPENEIKRIADVFSLEINSNELEFYKTEFLENNLRHTTFTSDDLINNNKTSKLLKDVYSTLTDLSVLKSINNQDLLEKISKWENELNQLNHALILSDKLYKKIADLNSLVEENNKQINNLYHEIKLKTEFCKFKENEVNQKNEELNRVEVELNQKNEELNHKNEELNHKSEELKHKSELIIDIINSKSWKITKPLRFIFKSFNNTSIKIILKKSFKGVFFAIKGIEIELFETENETENNLTDLTNLKKEIIFTPFKKNNPIDNIPVKIFAFYLPQFHAIPENDEWWGKGFTEWTNVKPAKPLFEGHHQPHVPVPELGYYNLLETKAQEFQVELAKNYGIGGFCFHFYWFNGKTLLEKPIENYLKNKQLDLPYCLSWANENWTRRWDGMENEILIKQQHSSDDDLAFIQHVSKYMKDKRYIRVDGKPLLMVYRPGLLPSAKETAERWRKWCCNNGIGEIYLANIESFEKINPKDIGYDAAVEFPPNPFKLVDFTKFIKPFDKEFNATVYDWKSVQNVSKNYDIPEYKLFRCICPSWDNTARRKNESRIFFNNHPDDFKDWVYNAGIDTINRFKNTDERLIFVNAWNEWAEGAHLEPDEKYGYVYLQNIYDSIKELSKLKKIKFLRVELKPKILVVSYNIPRPDRSSGELRFVSILEMLSEFWQIDFCVLSSQVEWNNTVELKQYRDKLSEIGINVLPVKKNTFIKTLKKNHYSGGYFNLYWVAEETMSYFKLVQPHAFTIVDSVDVHYAREESQAKLGEIEFSQVMQTKERELGVYKAADVTIAVSKDDLHLLTEIEGVKNVFLIPNIVKVYQRKSGKRDPNIVFIGSYTWYPNPEAVKWFVSSIWPKVIGSVTKAEFLIIGSDPTEEIKELEKLPGIKVIGYVAETKPYFETAALSVAPMRVGGGMKGKVNEALAHGIPVVATKIGAQGFEAIHGKHMMITDDIDEFADCVIKLLKDDKLQHDIGIAGQELNSAICSHEAVKLKIIDVVNFCNHLFPKVNNRNLLQWFDSNNNEITISNFTEKVKHLNWSKIKNIIKRTILSHTIKDINTKKQEAIHYQLNKPSKIIEFPMSDKTPLVSIIIPVYNQWEYTYSCLDSILKNSDDILYEVILADDNSTDETRFVEKYVKNIYVIRNEKNLGFLFNCNNAAKFAKGKYILFLNNDTLVQAEWLKWLIKPLNEKADVGLTGAKLVFSTGQLQEAGGIVFKDGSAMNYGREDSPDQSQYNYLKDVDYCSGACICVRKELWVKLNGFDPQYAPAYYEDTDLAMQIKSLGYRTVYQPKSIVIHFEGISNGTDISQGIKKKQVENQIKFYNKWKDELNDNNFKRDENLF